MTKLIHGRPTTPEEYRAYCSEPELWRASAIELKRSADLLWDQVDRPIAVIDGPEPGSRYFVSPYSPWRAALLLSGYAMENLLKGLVTQRETMKVGAHLPDKVSGHNMQGLASTAGLTVDKDEAHLLGDLKDIVEWVGRYPVAKKQGAQTTEASFLKKDFVVPFDHLWERVLAEFGKE